MKTNPHFQELTREYIFPAIERKVFAQKKETSEEIFNLGVGDVSLPLAPAFSKAIQEAVQEMATHQGKKGYGPEVGYSFLKTSIWENHPAKERISVEEIFISEGISRDAADLQQLFSLEATVGIMDPTYPLYKDACILAGRKKKIHLLPCNKENNFTPLPPSYPLDFVYLCTPNNPTGLALTKEDLQKWIAYAKKYGSVLLIDNAYEAFISSKDVPSTIYALEGAEEVAIEMRSFSKTAGFTGLRCGYTVIPRKIAQGKLHEMWKIRQTIQTNGISYPIQKGAAALFSAQGKKEAQEQIASYQKEALILYKGLKELNYTIFGGKDSPFLWWEIPSSFSSSWDFFDHLLQKCRLICVPGIGFGSEGEGYVRLSGFLPPQKAEKILERLCNLL